MDLGIDQKDLAEDNEEMERSFGVWKTKKFALTVPLRVVALRGSFPPSWIKVFYTPLLILQNLHSRSQKVNYLFIKISLK